MKFLCLYERERDRQLCDITSFFFFGIKKDQRQYISNYSDVLTGLTGDLCCSFKKCYLNTVTVQVCG